jgi:hypothetical protein
VPKRILFIRQAAQVSHPAKGLGKRNAEEGVPSHTKQPSQREAPELDFDLALRNPVNMETATVTVERDRQTIRLARSVRLPATVCGIATV